MQTALFIQSLANGNYCGYEMPTGGKGVCAFKRMAGVRNKIKTSLSRSTFLFSLKFTIKT